MLAALLALALSQTSVKILTESTLYPCAYKENKLVCEGVPEGAEVLLFGKVMKLPEKLPEPPPLLKRPDEKQ